MVATPVAIEPGRDAARVQLQSVPDLVPNASNARLYVDLQIAKSQRFDRSGHIPWHQRCISPSKKRNNAHA